MEVGVFPSPIDLLIAENERDKLVPRHETKVCVGGLIADEVLFLRQYRV